MAETDVVINLDDPRTKEIAEAITNKTSKQILQELTKENMSVSEISKNLKLPLNTVDYNIQKLAKAGLIERRSFFWSPKGRKMHVYGISNKRIIINPSSLGKRFVYFFAFLITGLLALGAKTIEYFFSETADIRSSSDIFLESVPEVATFAKIASDSCLPGVECIVQASNSGLSFTPGPIGWFLIGSWFAIILVIASSFIRDKKKKKN